MCHGCYEFYGKPTVINNNVLKVAKLIDQIYLRNASGGNLHVQLDDWNIEDEFFEGDLDQSSHEDINDLHRFELLAYELMKRMTLAERAAAIGFALHFWPFDAD